MTAPVTKVLDFMLEADREVHGYAVIQATEIDTGNVYRILRRLEKLGFLKSCRKQVDPDKAGPDRIYYRIRKKHRKKLLKWVQQAKCKKPPLATVINYLLEMDEKIHGYGLAKNTGVKKETVYKILRKLEQQGILTKSWGPSEAGPRRVYYRVVKKRRAELQKMAIDT